MNTQPELPMPDPAQARAWRIAEETSKQQFPQDTKRHAYYDEMARRYEINGDEFAG